MPKYSIKRQEELELLKKQAIFLYSQGYSYEKVGELVGKNRTFVYNAIKENKDESRLSTDTP